MRNEDMAAENNRESLTDGRYDAEKERYVTGLLHRLCISPLHAGFYYFREAILYADASGLPAPFHMDEIYAHIAVIFRTTSARVEKAMRLVLTQHTAAMQRAETLEIITGVTLDCPNIPLRAVELISYICEMMYIRSL